MEKNRRLLLMSFYEKNGLVNKYVIDLIAQLNTVCERIIFIVNGLINDESLEKIKVYTNEVIIRENIGLDFGAYRYCLLEYLKEEIEQYDELVLCNDTFYGFFTPINEIFTEMELKDVDMWGLNQVNRGILNHIQSYFIVFGKQIINDNSLIDYMKDNCISNNIYGQAAAYFETKLLNYFKSKKYKVASYTDTKLLDIYASVDICIENYHLPIMKRKCLNEDFCDREILLNALRYLENEKKISLMKVDNNHKGINKIGRRFLACAAITEEELLKWADKGKFYIFGYGNIAMELYYTYFEYNPNFMGFVVSNKSIQEDRLYNFSEISNDSRIIIGTRHEIQFDIFNFLPETMDKLLLWDY